MKSEWDVAVVGGGPAGLAAACSAKENGAERVVVIERDMECGGILNQCIHSGFGLDYFKEELTGPEYAYRFIEKAKSLGVVLKTGTTVSEIHGHDEKTIITIGPDGVEEVAAKAIVLSTGCRERTRGAIAIPGDRPSGVFTAGTAQKYLNIHGEMIGRRVVILGSGDIGLIMARRMTLEGAKVLACVEIRPYSNGLRRNIVQCLEDYGIPLYLSHTITNIKGKHRLEEVTVQKVDDNKSPVPGTEFKISCDTLLLSVGLIPENEVALSFGVDVDKKTKGPVIFENMETSIPGVFSCGNSLHVNDLVDYVTKESTKAGKYAALYAEKSSESSKDIARVESGSHVTYVIPQRLHVSLESEVEFSFRIDRPYKKAKILLEKDGIIIKEEIRRWLTPGRMEKIYGFVSPLTPGSTVTLFLKEEEYE